MPASTPSWAIPSPIVPAPTTPIRCGRSPIRQGRSLHKRGLRYPAVMSTIVIIVIAVVVIGLIALALTAGRRRKHAQLRETVDEHRQHADSHATRGNELEADARESREREREHAQVAAQAEDRLPDRNDD